MLDLRHYYWKNKMHNKLISLLFTIVTLSAFTTSLFGQGVTPGPSQTVDCKLHIQNNTDTLKKVKLAEFQNWHCVPDLGYFQALEYLPNPDYLVLRKSLKWDLSKTIPYKANVTTGTESFLLTEGLKIIRLYSSSSVTVTARNDGNALLYIEMLDIKPDVPPDMSTITYLAVPSHKERMLLKVQAMSAYPVWASGQMRVNVIFAPHGKR